jgi:hypothetical protein
MPSRGPLRGLAHDHADLNRRVTAVAARIGKRTTSRELISLLDELRDPLFFHLRARKMGYFRCSRASRQRTPHMLATRSRCSTRSNGGFEKTSAGASRRWSPGHDVSRCPPLAAARDRHAL